MHLQSFKKLLRFVLLGSTTVFTASCDGESDGPAAPKGAYERGVFITNEGSYGTPNGEVSYLDPTTKTLIPELFSKVNNRPLGDVVQSMTISNDKAFIVANNSNKIEVVNANTFKELGVINTLVFPRYMAALNNDKGYVTEWLTTNNDRKGRVAVLNLTTYTVTKTIEVGFTPEALLVHNGKLYVANLGENTVTIINTVTDQVERTIDLFYGPNSMAVDATGNIWILFGRTFYNSDWSTDYSKTTKGHLVKLNPTTLQTQSFEFPSVDIHPNSLVINGTKDKLYYQYNNGVYVMPTTATALPTTQIINRTDLYGLGIDPRENLIYVGAGPYSSNGRVIRFQPSGARVDSFQVRILPNGFTFR